MIRRLKEFVEEFGANKVEEGYLGWFVNLEGETLDPSDLLGDKETDAREIVCIEPGLVFFIDPDGTFDMDRCPDLFVLPATTFGQEVLEAAREVGNLSEVGDELQMEYLEAIDHMFHADRRTRGERTIDGLKSISAALGDQLTAHREEEKAARLAYKSLLLRLRDGERGEPLPPLDLTLPGMDGFGDED